MAVVCAARLSGACATAGELVMSSVGADNKKGASHAEERLLYQASN